jgi:hypothetical protein
MAMTEAKVNYNFHENFINVDLVKITNSSGSAYIHLQWVYEDGYFGEVREFDGIAADAEGYINIYSKRQITTTQIDTGDTFALKGTVYFNPTTGLLEAEYALGSVAVGTVTKINNGVSVEFMPYKQNNIPESVEMTSYAVVADASSSIDITGLVPEGATILDVFVECTAASGSGTLQLREETGDAAITNAIVCAVDNVVTRVTTLSISTVGANGLEIISNGAADRGIMTIVWRK